MRFGVLIPLLIAAFALLAPAGIQASVGPATADSDSSVIADRAAEKTSRRGKRPGCRKFCQQAGGFGDDCHPEVEDCGPVEIPAQKVGGTRDGVVSIKATCELDHPCEGAILLNSYKGTFGPLDRQGEYGRADLEIPAGETRNVKIGINKAGMKYLEKHGTDKSAFATVPLIDGTFNDYPAVPVSIGSDITLLKP